MPLALFAAAYFGPLRWQDMSIAAAGTLDLVALWFLILYMVAFFGVVADQLKG